MSRDLHRPFGELRLQFLANHLDQGIWDVDLRTNVFCASKAWCDMRGIPQQYEIDLSDGHWLDKIHPNDRSKLSKLAAGNIVDTSAEIAIQYRYKHQNGNWIWILCRAKVMEIDTNGRPTHLVGTDTAIDGIKRDAEIRAELTDKLRLALDASGIGIWEFNAATQRVYWDDQMLAMYGLQGQSNDQDHTIWGKYIHPDDIEATIAYSEDCQKKNADFNRDYRIVRPDGDVRHMRSLARFITTESGTVKLIGVSFDITADYERTQELENARNQLEYESRHDVLTGLANRRLLDETVTELSDRADPDAGYAVLHLDLDHFKTINDSLGHAAGDAVLSNTARILIDKTGPLGLVCRTGGDEFVVLLYCAIPQDDLGRICHEIVHDVSKPLTFEGKTCSSGVSIGVAYAKPGTTDHADTFRRADKALYCAKHAGRGGVEFYARNRSVNASDVANSRDTILEALLQGEIKCHYQPQYDAQTLAIIGAEALVRWECPTRGLLAPDQFLHRATEADVISHIDKHMLSLVLAQQTEWHKAGIPYPKISLNIAKDRILQPGLSDAILRQIEPHHKLSFELLETAFIDTPDTQMKRNIAQLREMNIQIELDDFGSGHSSIVALQTIKPDRIKIDRNLVTPIASHPDQLLTLSSLSRIARLEGAGIVIEGLETGLHLAAIRNVDCDVLQGFGLHRPVPPEDVAPLFNIDSIGDTSEAKIAAS